MGDLTLWSIPAKARAVWAPRENPDLELPTVASRDNQLGKPLVEEQGNYVPKRQTLSPGR